MRRTLRIFRVLGLVAVTGCSIGLRSAPDLAGLYNRAAEFQDASRNPVIVIPGILGSRLVDPATGRTVWGAFSGVYANPATAEGARLVALPMAEGVPLAELRDEILADGVLDRVRVSVLGLPVEQQAYLYILGTLGVGGYRDESLGRAGAIRYAKDHFTCFQFPYDWRRDNAENARLLHEFIVAKKAYVEAELERRYGIHRGVRFDVIAHSMGGLLLRYYLRYGPSPLPSDGSLPALTWAGARHVENAVLVATPNAGSVHALLELVHGIRFAFFLPRYGAAALGTMPSIYQLLPRTRHRAVVAGDDPEGTTLDVLNPKLWERMGWGLADPHGDSVLAELLPKAKDAAERRRIALDHLAKSLAGAERFHAALDVPASPPAGTSLYLFAGDAEPTAAVLGVDRQSGALRVLVEAPGDQTVLRTSAVMDERIGWRDWKPGLVSPIDWSGVTFVFGDHLALTRSPSFTDNLLYRLLDSPRGRGPGPAPIPPLP